MWNVIVLWLFFPDFIFKYCFVYGVLFWKESCSNSYQSIINTRYIKKKNQDVSKQMIETESEGNYKKVTSKTDRDELSLKSQQASNLGSLEPHWLLMKEAHAGRFTPSVRDLEPMSRTQSSVLCQFSSILSTKRYNSITPEFQVTVPLLVLSCHSGVTNFIGKE